MLTYASIHNDIYAQVVQKYLSLTDIIALSRVSKRFRGISRHNAFWKTKFIRHFPHYYELIKDTPHELRNDWLTLFIQATAEDYPRLSKCQQIIFFMAKEDDVAGLKAYLTKKKLALSQLINFGDIQNRTPIDWMIAQEFQTSLDMIYTSMEAILSKPTSAPPHPFNQPPSPRAELLKWALICHQPEIEIERIVTTTTNFNKALHVAAGFGHHTLIPYLIGKGVNPNDRTLHFCPQRQRDLRENPIHHAARKGYVEAVRELLQHNADPNAVSQQEVQGHVVIQGITPLHSASGAGHNNVVALLLESRCSPFAANSIGNTPLILAIVSEQAAMVRRFLEEANKFHGKQAALDKALFVAVACQQYRYIKPLKEAGANPHWQYDTDEITGFRGRSAIDLALALGNRAAIYDLLPAHEIEHLNFQEPTYEVWGAYKFKNHVSSAVGILAGIVLVLLLVKYTPIGAMPDWMVVLVGVPVMLASAVLGVTMPYLWDKLVIQMQLTQAQERIRNFLRDEVTPPSNIVANESSRLLDRPSSQAVREPCEIGKRIINDANHRYAPRQSSLLAKLGVSQYSPSSSIPQPQPRIEVVVVPNEPLALAIN